MNRMSDRGIETRALLLESVELNRAEMEEGPDNLWLMTLKSGSDKRGYLLNADHLRLLAEEIFKRVSS